MVKRAIAVREQQKRLQQVRQSTESSSRDDEVNEPAADESQPLVLIEDDNNLENHVMIVNVGTQFIC